MLRRPALLPSLALLFGLTACAKDPAASASPPSQPASNDIAASETPEAPSEGLVMDASPRTTPLTVGDAAPAFTLTDESGESFSLASKLESGPVIAIFYRGHW